MSKFIVYASLLLSIMSLQTTVSYACSGYIRDYPLPIEDFLPHTTIVRGTIIENNEGNSILQVDYYLRGSGAEYLLIYETSPLRQRSEYVYECVIEHKLNPTVGTEGYFLLYPNSDGTYGFGLTPGDQFIAIHNNMTIQMVSYVKQSATPDARDYVTPYEYASLSVADFEKMITDTVGQERTEPVNASRPLRFRPLYMTTESGQNYMMPIDSSQLVSSRVYTVGCNDECFSVSPDRNSVLYDISPDTDEFALWFLVGTPIPEWNDLPNRINPEGATPPIFTADDVIFSPDGTYVLAWYRSELILYAIERYPISEGDGYTPAILPMWKTALMTSTTHTYEDIVGNATWSSDSQAISFWDSDGLKWIDLRNMIIPDLIASHTEDEIPSVLEFAGMGQYLRYGTQSEWSLINLESRVILDDTLISPDGIQFFSISPEIYPRNSVRENILEQYGCLDIFRTDDDGGCIISTVELSEGCKPPFMGCAFNIRLTEGFEVHETYWLSDNRLAVFMCDMENKSLCTTTHGRASTPPLIDTAVQTNAFEFDPIYEQFAWAFDDYILTFSTNPGNSLYNLDLSDQLDSPIVNLQWGEPLWYVEP